MCLGSGFHHQSFCPFTLLYFFVYYFQSLMVLDCSKRVCTLSRMAREVIMQQVESTSAPLPLLLHTVVAQTSGPENVILQHDSSHISVALSHSITEPASYIDQHQMTHIHVRSHVAQEALMDNDEP
jgi:fibronectin type 3 domain-containing protein